MYNSFLSNFPIYSAIGAIMVMFITSFSRKHNLFLFAMGILVSTASLAPVDNLTASLGFGASWILLGIAAVCLVIHFRLGISRLLFFTQNTIDFILLLFLCYSFFTVFFAYSPVNAVRKSLSAWLVVFIGWHLLSAIFNKYNDEIRKIIYTLISGAITWNIVYVILITVILGSKLLHPIPGWITVNLGFLEVARLQYPTVFIGTAVSTSAAVGIIYIFYLYQIAKLRELKIIAAIMFGILAVILIWGGGRTALLAFLITIAYILFVQSYAKQKNTRVIRYMVLAIMLFVAFLITEPILKDFVFRGVPSNNLVEALVSNRLENAISTMQFFRNRLILGAGAGTIEEYIKVAGVPYIESFLFQPFIEYGFLMGTVYFAIWILITIIAIKNVTSHLQMKQPGAWLVSSILVFVWAGAPASYGFGLFSSPLILYLAIGASVWKERGKQRFRVKNNIKSPLTETT